VNNFFKIPFLFFLSVRFYVKLNILLNNITLHLILHLKPLIVACGWISSGSAKIHLTKYLKFQNHKSEGNSQLSQSKNTRNHCQASANFKMWATCRLFIDDKVSDKCLWARDKPLKENKMLVIANRKRDCLSVVTL